MTDLQRAWTNLLLTTGIEEAHFSGPKGGGMTRGIVLVSNAPGDGARYYALEIYEGDGHSGVSRTIHLGKGAGTAEARLRAMADAIAYLLPLADQNKIERWMSHGRPVRDLYGAPKGGRP